MKSMLNKAQTNKKTQIVRSARVEVEEPKNKKNALKYGAYSKAVQNAQSVKGA